ncbi:hypothetical protein SPHINGOAX6_20137 [Sphingomonas sp. AX6]|nr:hypothetical protein SPHINGOAX6_20137 [Sphingomonas sp. AX6]
MENSGTAASVTPAPRQVGRPAWITPNLIHSLAHSTLIYPQAVNNGEDAFESQAQSTAPAVKLLAFVWGTHKPRVPRANNHYILLL